MRPEIKDSSYKNSELGRQRVYGAFEVYKKFKQELQEPKMKMDKVWRILDLDSELCRFHRITRQFSPQSSRLRSIFIVLT